MRVLVVEDDAELAGLIGGGLQRVGFVVDRAAGAAQCEDCLAAACYDMVILDLALLSNDGRALLRRLRSRGVTLPVLVLTACDGLGDRVAGLDAGTEFYLAKPFHMSALIVHVRALSHRSNGIAGARLELGNLLLDAVARRTSAGGIDLSLTVRETMLLELLLHRQGNVVTRAAIGRALYDFGAQFGSNAIEVLVHRLRRKLSQANTAVRVHTVRRVGYLVTWAK